MIGQHASRLLGALALGAVLAAVSGGASASADPSASPAPALIVIKNYAFVPASITIKPGTSVQWRNDDSIAHTATSSDGTFDSKDLDRGMTYTFTFTKAGKYAYVCSYHSNMTGTVIVSDSASQ